MNRLYQYIGNLSTEEQIELIDKTALSSDEKNQFKMNVMETTKECEKMIAHLEIDHPTQILLETFASMVRNQIQEEFSSYIDMSKVDKAKSERVADEKLTELLGEEEARGFMNVMKKTAKSVFNTIIEVAKMLFNAIKYFLRKGFDLLKWVFNHPSTAMWLTYSALFLKKKVCQMVSLQVYGDPAVVEVGLFGKGRDMMEQGSEAAAEFAQIVKRTFLANTYQFIGSSGYLTTITGVIENGILFAIGCIPGVGTAVALAIKTSGGLTIVMKGAGSVLSEAMYYGFTAMMVKEAGNDLYAIITGTCITPPKEMKSLTMAGVSGEVSYAFDKAKDTVGSLAEQTSGFFRGIASLGI
jgi:hypothetical protein